MGQIFQADEDKYLLVLLDTKPTWKSRTRGQSQQIINSSKKGNKENLGTNTSDDDKDMYWYNTTYDDVL